MMHIPEQSISSLSIVVPVFNEEATIINVLNELSKVQNYYSSQTINIDVDVIVVDDASTDNTQNLCQTFIKNHDFGKKITYVRHKRNLGKGGALKTGFYHVTGEILIIQDGDLEYDPNEIPLVIAPIIEGKADVVYGSRFLVKKTSRVLYFYHYLANKFLTFLSNILTNMNMTDIETGYKAFRSQIVKNMIINSPGFGFEVEVTAKIAKLRCRVYEVPISYYGRTYEEGKKITYRDGIRAIILILYYNIFISRNKSFKKEFLIKYLN